MKTENPLLGVYFLERERERKQDWLFRNSTESGISLHHNINSHRYESVIIINRLSYLIILSDGHRPCIVFLTKILWQCSWHDLSSNMRWGIVMPPSGNPSRRRYELVPLHFAAEITEENNYYSYGIGEAFEREEEKHRRCHVLRSTGCVNALRRRLKVRGQFRREFIFLFLSGVQINIMPLWEDELKLNWIY